MCELDECGTGKEGRDRVKVIGGIGLERIQGSLPSLLIGFVWRVVNSGLCERGTAYSVVIL